MTYFCQDKYLLKLSWSGIEFPDGITVKLTGAKFSGPALAHAEKISNADTIRLDLTPQNAKLVSSFYIAELTWDGVAYQSDGSIDLETATLRHQGIHKVKGLESKDYLVIDTSKHEEKTHQFFFNYDALLVKENGEVYSYA